MSHHVEEPASKRRKRGQANGHPIGLAAMGIKMVVFDCAGTVIDEGAIVYESLRKVMSDEGLQFTADEFNQWHGANKVEVIRHFYFLKHKGKGKTEEELEERVQFLYQEFQNLIKKAYFGGGGSIKLFDGVLDLFSDLRAAGIKVALDTGYPREIADGLIASLGLEKHIDGSCVAEEVGAGRPYPYMIHSLMKQHKIMDVRAVAKVGDTARDMQEGRNAGCSWVVGVLSGADGEDNLKEAGADTVLQTVRDMTA